MLEAYIGRRIGCLSRDMSEEDENIALYPGWEKTVGHAFRTLGFAIEALWIECLMSIFWRRT